MVAVDSQIERLLILQDRDMRRLNLIASLEAVPNEVAKAQAQIAQARAKIEAGKQAVQALQVQRKDIAGKVTVAEEQVVRYKTQQLQVKKNEEYQALTSEIERTQSSIAQLEDEELTLLLDIDAAQDRHVVEQEALLEEIALLEKEVATLRERESVLAAQRGEAEAATEQAAAGIAPAYIDAYRRVGMRKAKQPWIVPLVEHKCGGCHLKVSGEVESNARDATAPVHCDNCGRVIFWESY